MRPVPLSTWVSRKCSMCGRSCGVSALQALRWQWALPRGPRPQPSGMQWPRSSQSRPRDDVQEFRGKSPQWPPPPTGLSRQAPLGFTTHF